MGDNIAMPLIKSDRKYTWEDYKTWTAGERWEIIEGVPYCMSPAPSTTHQKIVLNIAVKAGGFFEKHPHHGSNILHNRYRSSVPPHPGE